MGQTNQVVCPSSPRYLANKNLKPFSAAQRVFEAAGKEELTNACARILDTEKCLTSADLLSFSVDEIKAKWREERQPDHCKVQDYELLSVNGLNFVYALTLPDRTA